MLKTIIFDFDGTIADTQQLFNDQMQNLAKKYDFIPLDLTNLEKYSGRSYWSIAREHRVPWYKIIFMLYHYKKLIANEIIAALTFKGMKELIIDLSKEFELQIVSTNYKNDIDAFLDVHKILLKFKKVYTSFNFFGKHKVLKRIIKKEKLNLGEVIYVGDEVRDIIAAHKAGMKVISVTWGFNSRELLESHTPDYIANTIDELRNIITKLKNEPV